MPPVTKGKHKFAYCQTLYQESHEFIQQREWAPIQLDNETGCTTWVELFTLFNAIGAISETGSQIKDLQTRLRPNARQAKLHTRTK